MVTTGAVLHGDRKKLLGYSPQEHPLALQLGGSEPEALAQAARIGEDFGYDEINLNVGCPSDRVQNGRFGACLMLEPGLVGVCVGAMKAAVKVPVTVKCRLAVDDQDPEQALDQLANEVVAAGADALIVHARKAWLSGLSPKENRTIPPLDYNRIARLQHRFIHVPIILNGGIASLEAGLDHIANVHGVMLGRAAYHEPWRLLPVDQLFFDEEAPFADALQVAEAMEPYIAHHIEQGGRLTSITKHMLGLFTGRPGARAYRRYLSENANHSGAGLEVWRVARDLVSQSRQAA